MSATVVPLPPNSTSETTDFLRRMASMVSGRNGEMLLRAAAMIDSLTHRAVTAEQLYHRQQEDSARNKELREVAELASDALVTQIDTLRAELAETAGNAAEERALIEAERARQEAECDDLIARAEDAEARLAGVTAELEALQASVDTFNETAVTVPIEVLRLARAQFDALSDGFARNGDVISQAISEIGGCAIDQALAGKTTAGNGD